MGMELCSSANIFFDIVRNDKQLRIIQMYEFSRLHMQWCNWWEQEGRIAPTGKLHVNTGRHISLWGSSLVKKKNSTRLGQHRKSTGEFGRSAQGTPKLTIEKLRPARFAQPAQFITIGLYSLMVLFW